jgi:hypothetical protein
LPRCVGKQCSIWANCAGVISMHGCYRHERR